MASALDSIVEASTQEPPELPRLPVGSVFLQYERLGKLLERAVDAYKAIPACTQQSCGEQLKELIKSCDAAAKSATRLLEANQ